MTAEFKIIACLLCIAWSPLAMAQCPNFLDNSFTNSNGINPLTLSFPLNGTPDHLKHIDVSFGLDDTDPTNNFVGTNVPVERFSDQYQTMGANFNGVLLDGTLTLRFEGGSEKVCQFEADSPTPVELTDWSGILKSNDIELHWSTAWEENNAGFEIQRSYDGLRFETAGMVEGVGNSQLENHYHYVDIDVRNKALGATAYYRLAQVDYDGTRTLSPVIAIDLELDYSDFEITKVIGERRISVYYFNPANVRKINLIVSNLQGNLLLKSSLRPTPGINVLELDLSNHPGNLIFLSMDNGRKIIQQKLFLADLR